jgi:branched-chain amino acid transport system ATP-binding protein
MTVILSVEAVSKVFGGFRAVDDVSFGVEEGSIHALIGPNGAGKTTLFRLLTGVLPPSSGVVRFVGAEIAGRSPHSINRLGLAQSFQITNVFSRLTALESLQAVIVIRRRRSFDFFSRFHASAGVRAEAFELLAQVGLEHAAEAETRTLSHGDQRALEVALALASGPRLLLLDEPTAGMSPFETAQMVRMVRRLARDRKLTVLFSEHDTDVVFGISDRITVMHRGRVIAEGDANEIQRNPEVAAVYLGVEA